MKSPYETLQEQLKARFPRIVVGDSDVLDEIDEDHTLEQLAPLYQLPPWELRREARELSRKLRAEGTPTDHPPCQGSCTVESGPGYGQPPVETTIDHTRTSSTNDGGVDDKAEARTEPRPR